MRGRTVPLERPPLASERPPQASERPPLANKEDVSTARSDTYDDGSVRLGLAGRLDEVRRLGRARRLRVQLPLGLFSVLVSASSAIAALVLDWILLGAFGMWLGLWLCMLCVMPNDRRSILLAIALVTLCTAATGVFLLIPLAKPCNPNFSRRSCITNGAVCAFGVLTTFLHSTLAARIGLKLWRRARPPRAALDSIWRCMGSVMVSLAVPFFIGASENVREASRYSQNNGAESAFSTAVQAGSRAVLGVEWLLLGGLALWPRLRAVVQAKLASMGEGVAAAAGISELLGFAPTHELIALAQATLRSVRLDQLRPSHLDVTQSAADAFAVSTIAQIGSIDAFLSHSWHDPPEEKWRLLQTWREQFVRTHGREPTIWLDRCCLRAEELSSLLPCLPLYCAACDCLLALRGPSYLSRLWCVIEIFVFFEMRMDSVKSAADAAYIQVLDFDGVPAYPAAPHAHGWTNPAGFSLPVAERPRFDVRACKCASAEDEERMLAVMESTGAGAGAFNSFMHELLLRTSSLPPTLSRHSTLARAVDAGPSSATGAAGCQRPSFGPLGRLSASVAPLDLQQNLE